MGPLACFASRRLDNLSGLGRCWRGLASAHQSWMQCSKVGSWGMLSDCGGSSWQIESSGGITGWRRLNPSWVAHELCKLLTGATQRNLYSWNKTLSKSVRDGDHSKTLELFQQITAQGLTPDTFSFVAALQSCSNLGALEEGNHLHKQIC